ncbi:amino acid/peptide transporter [Clostridium intestinale URNW]|uniref:Amino acid/peptide transporter n=1 Tax=Clostridium intestinale URNW TaxID=1294142 RepID=U2NSE4_9CLOT|nr:amino acid/peptide transporter [Clostridium intestinale URNW]
MEENKLLEFCKDKEIDWRSDELVIWIHYYDLDDFTEIMGFDYMSEGGIKVDLQYSQVAINLVPICEYLGIEPTDILEKPIEN